MKSSAIKFYLAYLSVFIIFSWTWSLFSFILPDKTANRTIIGSFALGCEETAWKLLDLPVISDALAASSFAVTGFIGTGASSFIFI